MGMYGQGDNSVTDRMWYELALKICKDVQTSCNDYSGDLVPELIASILSDKFNKNKDFTDDAKKIYGRLLSLRTAFTSRISVEYVRQQLERISESS